MKGCIENDDFEYAHRDADGILIEMVEILAQNQEENNKILIKDILLTYDKVGKWYA